MKRLGGNSESLCDFRCSEVGVRIVHVAGLQPLIVFDQHLEGSPTCPNHSRLDNANLRRTTGNYVSVSRTMDGPVQSVKHDLSIRLFFACRTVSRTRAYRSCRVPIRKPVTRSIQHRPERPSAWRARYRAPDGRERSKSFRRKVDAEVWLRDQQIAADRGSWVNPRAGTATYADWASVWLAGLHNLKPKTKAGYENLLGSRILPTFGQVELRNISPASVRDWISLMAEEGLSASRIRQARQVLRASLDQAVLDRIIGFNATDGAKVPREQPREARFLTAEQVEVLAGTAADHQNGANTLVTLLAYTGLRWGEAVALRRSRLDILRRTIHIAESATEVGGRLVFGTPKTHRDRTVVVPRFIADELALHLAKRSGGDGDDLVFIAPRGGPLRVGTFRRNCWLPAVTSEDAAAAGVPADLTPHDLRHTAASLMISAGASVKAVQKALGHSSATITLDRYSHLYREDLDALADALDDRWAEAVAAHTRPRPDTDRGNNLKTIT